MTARACRCHSRNDKGIAGHSTKHQVTPHIEKR
jgi:hypothetical protein